MRKVFLVRLLTVTIAAVLAFLLLYKYGPMQFRAQIIADFGIIKTFKEEKISPEASKRDYKGPYQVKFEFPANTESSEWDPRIIRIIGKDGKPRYSWKRQYNTTFAIVDDMLYYTQYSEYFEGCRVEAIDLKSGRKRWQTDCKAIGFHAHSAYENQVAISARKDMVFIQGDEEFGRYFEVLDTATGKTIGHASRMR